ncbi:AIR synthase-related protein, partial [Acinetobacter baumannii]
SCHDLSEGGLGVALAEMAFAGGVGADVTKLGEVGNHSDDVLLFSESPTRFVVEVAPTNVKAFESCLAGVPIASLGQTVKEPRLRVSG